MGWYEELDADSVDRAWTSPAGLAGVHTAPYPPSSRWRMFPYMEYICQHVMPVLLAGGKAMVFMPPRHGKSMLCSVYIPAWFEMVNPTKNTILTSYSAELSADFSSRARGVVSNMGHNFGVRINPNQNKRDHWQVQYLDEDEWVNAPAGGEVYSAGVDGPLPGRGGHLIVMDDVVRGHKDTSRAMMEKAYGWYRSVLETRCEPNTAMLLVMTRWAMADLAGRLLEDEADDWDVTVLPALAKEDDPLGRELGEALCPARYDKDWLERKRDSSDEGGLIFAALYQQEPMPEDGAIFKADQLLRWEGRGDAVLFGNNTVPVTALLLWFATIDPALKDKELNDPTGFLVWALSHMGDLLLMEDHTKRMRGSTDLLPKMHQVLADHPGIQFFVEDKAHGTEIMRACERDRLPVLPLEADRDKVTRAIGAQPAFAAGKVFIPAQGAEPLVREMLEFPGGRHDDRVDCIAYAVAVWRERIKQLHPGPVKQPRDKEEPAELHNVHPADRPEKRDGGKDRAGKWRP